MADKSNSTTTRKISLLAGGPVQRRLPDIQHIDSSSKSSGRQPKHGGVKPMANDPAGLASTSASHRTFKAAPPSKQSRPKVASRRKAEGCTLEEAAAIHFEAVPDFGDYQEMEKTIQTNVVFLRIALATMGRSKAQLVDVWKEEEGQELFMKLHGDLVATAEWFRISADFINKAALRLMASGAASVVGTASFPN